MIPELEQRIRELWESLETKRRRPHRFSTLKLSTSDYPDPISAVLYLVFADNETQPCAVAKTARILAGNAAIEIETRRLQETHEVLSSTRSSVVPQVLHTGAFNQRSYLLMNALPGHVELHSTWSARQAAKAEKRIAAALSWSLCMARETLGPPLSAQEWLGNENPEQLIESLPASKLASSLGKDFRERLGQRLQKACEVEWPMCWTHGDYFPGNVLFEGNIISGVVDWSLASGVRPVFFDTLSYELSFTLQSLFRGEQADATRYFNVAHLAPFQKARRTVLDEFSIDTGIGSTARAATLLSWSQRGGGENPTHAKVALAALRLLLLELQTPIPSVAV